MSEYLEFRCCMCPNINFGTSICPHGPFKKTETPCRFVKTYIDKRGWIYKVDTGNGYYRAKYKTVWPGTWMGVKILPWREEFDEAQADLNRLAKEKGWEELK